MGNVACYLTGYVLWSLIVLKVLVVSIDHGWVWQAEEKCYALTGRSSLLETSLSGVGSGLSALATCDADMW